MTWRERVDIALTGGHVAVIACVVWLLLTGRI